MNAPPIGTRAPRRGGRAQAGFTLVELLMGIILMSIFALALYGFFFAGLDSARSHQVTALAQSNARTAIDRLVREARQAISPDDRLTAPIASITPTSVEMYVDPQRSTSTLAPRPYKVRYSIVGNQLIRDASAPVGASAPFTYGPYTSPEVLAEDVRNGAIPLFSSITAQGDAMPATVSGPQTRDIAQISVRLIVGQRTGNAATTLELTTDVSLRNAIRL